MSWSRNRIPTALLALLTAISAAIPYGSVAGAQSTTPRPIFGIGDQKPSLFTDPRLAWLGVRYARLIVPWDVVRVPWELAAVDVWMAGARRMQIEPLVAFDSSVQNPRLLPSAGQYLNKFLDFQRRYPWVHDYTPWNEENLRTKPIATHPDNAARYYNVLSAHCPGCSVVAADVLDTSDMVHYLRTVARLAHDPTLWGVHNYVDVNTRSTRSTRRLLAAVGGTIWFTEVGGVVWRKDRRKGLVVDGDQRAARAAAWIFHLAYLSPRIRRIYYYQWRSVASLQHARSARSGTWDSGLIDSSGLPRPAFDVIARKLGRDPSRAPRAPRPSRRLEVGVPSGVTA